jgi:TatD DNase family protein
MLIDTHTHISDSRYKTAVKTAGDIVKNLKNDGLEAIVEVGYDYASSMESLGWAVHSGSVYAAVGFHPHDAEKASYGLLDAFKTHAGNKRLVAVGEIGLDYHYEADDKIKQKIIQKKAFAEQLSLAQEMNRPVIIHSRDASADTYEILKNHKNILLKNGGVMHSFSQSKELARDYLDLNLYISFSGVITFKNNTASAEIIKYIPKDRLLVETDCPYLTPDPFRGQLNYPEYVKYTARKTGEILGLSFDEISELTTANAKRLFNIK